MNVSCQICGTEMNGRINGSHLKRKHGIVLDDYIRMFPDVNIGSYEWTKNECKICGMKIDGAISSLIAHTKHSHDMKYSEYKIQYEPIMCGCGCGELSDYNYERNRFFEFKQGHYVVWNKGLTKYTHSSIGKGGGWNKGFTMETHPTMKLVSQKCKQIWIDGGDELKQKMVQNLKKSMLDKYGVDNANYLETGVKFKPYITPSGNIIKYQGYENYLLDKLLQKYDESDIVNSRKLMPRFEYLPKKSYIGDILVESTNTVYEVKSTWTWKIFKHFELKRDAVLKHGYNYAVYIYGDRKGKLVESLFYNK